MHLAKNEAPWHPRPHPHPPVPGPCCWGKLSPIGLTVALGDSGELGVKHRGTSRAGGSQAVLTAASRELAGGQDSGCVDQAWILASIFGRESLN